MPDPVAVVDCLTVRIAVVVVLFPRRSAMTSTFPTLPSVGPVSGPPREVPPPSGGRGPRVVSLLGSWADPAAKAAWGLLAGHVLALLFGLAGLLIAIPNSHLWADSELGVETYNFGMKYGGATHILFGAAAVFALGVLAVGLWRTALFFVAAVVLSAGSELVGTGTGWPFGNYEYTDYLGYRLLDRVPFTIPLSWFYMGLASYLLARVVVAMVGRRLGPVGKTGWTVGLGVWFVVVWDLVLDPAMAHEDLSVKFWEWHETGPYFGMPIQNYLGWAFTAALYMGLSRLLWGREADPTRYAVALPAGIYVANIVFASALSLSVGLWLPVVLAVALGVLPVLIAWRIRRTTPPTRPLVPSLGGSTWAPSGR